jgi:excisionase family DNA binding protein
MAKFFLFSFSYFSFCRHLACLPGLNPEGGEDCFNSSGQTLSQTRTWFHGNLASMEINELISGRSFTPSEVAEILGMKTSSVYALISRGYLQANRIGTRRIISTYQLDHYLLNRGGSGQVASGYHKSNLVIR